MIGKTGNEISAKIREIMGNKNITIQCEDKTATVTGVTIKQNGNVVKVFSSNDANLEFTIQVEKKVVTPAPTPKAENAGGGIQLLEFLVRKQPSAAEYPKHN